MKERVDVSIILCAYNEEDVIESTISDVDRVMSATNWSFEIVVVDDGSSDNTGHKAVNYKKNNGNNRMKIIGYEKNLGKPYNGTYFLRTDRNDLNDEKIWSLYIMLTTVEDAFRCLKDELGLRPNFHHKPNRIEGHIFVTVL